MSAVYLSSLKLKGFRSYAGQTEVTFPSGPGLTVIVGPNGFGKSTLFDAVEWALTGDLKRMGGITAKDKEERIYRYHAPCAAIIQRWYFGQSP